MPKSRQSYWRPKFEANIDRDRRKIAALRVLGWKVGVIWECETRNAETLARRLMEILE